MIHGSLDNLKIELDMLASGAERIVGKNPPLDIIAREILFGEGPVWDARNKQFIFTDIIGDTIWKWKPGSGQEVVLKPSAKANGLALDLENRLVVAGWGGRTVFRFEKDGSRKTLADRWQGKKLNSPNDIIVKSDGSIWFTDSPGGLFNVGMVGDDLQRYLDIQAVFRISPDGKEMTLVTDDFVYPNGLCFSPNEKLLYVNCSRERLIRVYDVKPDGSVDKGRLFYQYTGPERGLPDGMKCDVEGNVYCTGPGGIFVHDPAGKVLARIKTPGHYPTNLAWGDDDWRSLYITMLGSVVRTRLNIAGVPSR
ncbi:MAG: SMP-30/gluconolactonase/LRE family protein [Betaproteobacteria bacterium]|nr:SMP-30/gluconolactonase/LRE family protein [Betaproteobacteria bacterium]